MAEGFLRIRISPAPNVAGEGGGDAGAVFGGPVVELEEAVVDAVDGDAGGAAFGAGVGDGGFDDDEGGAAGFLGEGFAEELGAGGDVGGAAESGVDEVAEGGADGGTDEECSG